MNKIDETLDGIQNTRFINLYHNLIRQMTRQTQFTDIEVSSILMIYYKFVLANGPKAKRMQKKQFSNLCLVLFKIYDVHIIERIQMYLTSDVGKDIDPTSWVRLFSVFMSTNLEEKMRFAFGIYNIHNNGLLDREIVINAVEKFFTGDDEDEINELRSDMVELIFKKFDVDKDGAISYEDYSSIVVKQPMLLEFLGQVFPATNGMSVIAYCGNIMSIISKEKLLEK